MSLMRRQFAFRLDRESNGKDLLDHGNSMSDSKADDDDSDSENARPTPKEPRQLSLVDVPEQLSDAKRGRLSVEDEISNVLRIARDNTSSIESQAEALSEIEQLCSLTSYNSSPSIRERIMKMGGSDAVKMAMLRSLDNVNLQRAGCAAIANLYSEGEGRVGTNSGTRVVDDDHVRVVVAAMGTHPCDLSVQRQGCRALVPLTRASKSPEKSIVASKAQCFRAAVGAVIGAMQAHTEDAEMQVFALCALLNLSKKSSSIHAIVNANGPWSIVVAMQNHPRIKTICSAACFILAKLSEEGGECAQAVKDVPGVSSTVLQIMSDYCDLRIQADCCKILCNACSGRGGCKEIINESEGIIETLLKAMQQQIHTVEVKVCCVKAIHHICSEESVALDHELEQSIIIVVVGLMENLFDSCPLQIQCFKLLWKVSLHSNAARRYIAGIDGICTILSIARCHMNSSKIQEKCFDTMHILAEDPDVCSVLLSEGCVETILHGMTVHRKDTAVQEAGVSALCALCLVKCGQESIRQHGGTQLVLMAMKMNIDNEILQGNALATICKSGIAQMKATDLEIIVSSILAYPKSCSVNKWACQCLFNISKSKDTSQAFWQYINQDAVMKTLKDKCPLLAEQLKRTLSRETTVV